MSENKDRIFRRVEDDTARSMAEIQESGELRRLYGTSLELDDDPDWLITRTLKQQGFNHPVLERARELDAPRREAEQVLERLARRRAWLEDPRSGGTAQDVQAFNEQRRGSLETYRDKLQTLNRAVRDYNLSVPVALHQRPVAIDDAVSRAAQQIPPLTVGPAVSRADPAKPRRSGLLRRRK